ncbi:histidine phosphatase family protein [Paenibacillus pinisoli]|uniref:Histidine phosphatase family protein n=1 Tax=Paenibacillus pinisoli TaxID=1276110 RepID=A0A3A6PCH5_9BACL|nr:histidine phosphatase family protein [Paenibacillus pinisoli]RJX37640.1 histidine phosphatase family protein [Paenibacillus pinisoli]
METVIYLVRHAESIYAEGNERNRGLTEEGEKHAFLVRGLLESEHVEAFFSSPYERAIATVRPAAEQQGQQITLYEDLRERAMGRFEPAAFLDAKKRIYAEKNFAYPGGEASWDAQARAVSVVEQLLSTYNGKKLAIGTHGDIMTLIMQHYDSQYEYTFWASLSMPDIYRLTFAEKQLTQAARLWAVN